MIATLLAAVLLASDAPIPPTVEPPRPDAFAALRFLLGTWEGGGSAEAGLSSGRFTFEKQLGGKVLVRTNRTELINLKKGYTVHEDLLVVHPAEGGLRARYWDNEGNVIDYTVSVSPDGKLVTFLGDAGPGPRFRLTYEKLPDEQLTVRFAVAPPGQPEAFRTHVEGTCRRPRAPPDSSR